MKKGNAVLMTVEECAELVGVSYFTYIRRYVKMIDHPKPRFERPNRFLRTEIERWLMRK